MADDREKDNKIKDQGLAALDRELQQQEADVLDLEDIGGVMLADDADMTAPDSEPAMLHPSEYQMDEEHIYDIGELGGAMLTDDLEERPAEFDANIMDDLAAMEAATQEPEIEIELTEDDIFDVAPLSASDSFNRVSAPEITLAPLRPHEAHEVMTTVAMAAQQDSMREVLEGNLHNAVREIDVDAFSQTLRDAHAFDPEFGKQMADDALRKLSDKNDPSLCNPEMICIALDNGGDINIVNGNNPAKPDKPKQGASRPTFSSVPPPN
ncbi:MAG: hypothetical protein OXT65_05915 [Alphaproteobacteria bacterium]|nr:hypothetical protein [Alphaproteobacteria bacterium]